MEEAHKVEGRLSSLRLEDCETDWNSLLPQQQANSAASWLDVPLQLQEQILGLVGPREQRILRQLNKPCRQQALQHFIKRLTVHASKLAVESLAASQQTLTQRYCSLLALSIIMPANQTQLDFVGQSTSITSLDLSLNQPLTKQLVQTTCRQLPGLCQLKMTQCRNISGAALMALSALTALTALVIGSDLHDKRYRFSLHDVPMQLTLLRSLEVIGMADVMHTDAAAISQLTSLTRLVLAAEAECCCILAVALAQLTILQHLALPDLIPDVHGPRCTHMVPGFTMLSQIVQQLTTLTALIFPHMVHPPKSYQKEPLPRLQHLACRDLQAVIQGGQELAACTYLEFCGSVANLYALLPAALPNLQYVKFSKDSRSLVDEVFEKPFREQFAAVPQLCMHLQWLSINIRNWSNLTAFVFGPPPSYDKTPFVEQVPHIQTLLKHIRSLCLHSMPITGRDIIAVCEGLPCLRELVLIVDEGLYIQEWSGPCSVPTPATLIANFPAVAKRNLRIGMPSFDDLTVAQVNMQLQDLGCDGIVFDNSAEFVLW